MGLKFGYKQTEIGAIPQDWEVKLLREVAQIRSGFAKNGNATAPDSVLVTYLRVANVQDGYLDLSDLSQIEVPQSSLQRYAVLPGDVLMNEGGDIDKLGRGSIWHGEITPCIHQNHVFVVRCKKIVTPEFLTIWSSGSTARKYFQTAGKQTTNLASINKTSLGGLPVVVPHGGEQQAISTALSDVDTLIQSLDQLIAKKSDLKQAAMQQLLTGQTRLPGFQGEWQLERLGRDVLLLSGHHVLAEHWNTQGEGVPYITGPADFPEGRIEHTKFTTRPSTICAPNDILVTVKGSGAGTIVLADAAYCISRQLMAIRVVCSDCRFLYYSLQQTATKFNAAATGLIPGLSRSDILDQQLPMPPTLAEQTAVAKVLTDMDMELAALKQRRDKTVALKQGMMQELLTGRTRLL